MQSYADLKDQDESERTLFSLVEMLGSHLIYYIISKIRFYVSISEKRGFLTRNLIGRSPPDEEKNGNSNGGNLELLRVLESKFASPIASSSRAPSMNNSPSFTHWMNENPDVSNQNFDYGYREKGLLDASIASLIDDIDDFLD